MDRDPWYWDAGDVLSFFHDHAAETLPESQRSRLPPTDDFFEALQSEGVTGDCLLTAIDIPALRDEYGIRSAMTRSAVWTCICKLRTRSAEYATQHGLPMLQAPTPRSLPPANLPEAPLQPPLESVAVSVEDAANARVGENTRSGEYQVQDAQGRKRRKLELANPNAPRTQRALTKPKKTYLPRAAISADKIYYGSIGYGEEIENAPTDGIITVLDADREDGLDDNDFQFQRADKVHGESDFVHKQLKRMFLSAEVVDMQRQGRDALAMIPFPQAPSATVIQFTAQHGERPVAFKENVKYLNSSAPEKHAAVGGEWEFLAEKYAASDDPLLPEYGNSETDLEGSKILEEEEDGDSGSMAEESIAPDELSHERASEIIDEALKRYAVACDDRVAKWEEKKAYTVWNKMKRSRIIRHNLTQDARVLIEQLDRRLKNQKVELLSDKWSSEASLEKMCSAMQVTVEDIEYQRWMTDVWGRKQEPWHAKSKRKALTNSKHDASTRLEDGGQNRLVIPENERFSVSPPPTGPDDLSTGRVDDDAVAQDQDNYAADDEQFHTPLASPEPEQQSPDAVAGADDLDDDPSFIVNDDDDYVDGEGPESADLPTVPPSSSRKHKPIRRFAGSDAESDLPSPSTLKLNMPKREPPTSTPSNRRIMSIDLTGGSPSSEAPTPTVEKAGKKKIDIMDDPDWATLEEIDGWDYEELVKTGDRRRILIKVLRGAGAAEREELHKRYLLLQRAHFSKQLSDTLAKLRHEDPASFEDDQSDPLRLAAGIYLRWHFPALLTTARSSDIPWNSALAADQVSAFAGLLDKSLKVVSKLTAPKTNTSGAAGSSSANAISLSSDNDAAQPSQRTSRKRRKRAVEQSQVAVGNRQRAFERMQRAELAESQSAANSSQLAAMIDANPEASSVHINFLKDEDQPKIHVSRKIATKMKQHQIEGARFLWREITASDEDVGHGCVLAHTMGLGKTMQTIALLTAVSDAAHSKDKSVRLQLPKHLRAKSVRKGERNLRILILCPPGLIQNWDREIRQWVDKKLGYVFLLGSSVKPADRPGTVKDWMRVGGVLILGYELFRSLARPSTDKRQKKASMSEETAAELLDNLLKGPEIVVADEAHNLKNEKSAVATAAKQFETESKIALTGTPMSNDVLEIYALVSWVSPDYLGEPTEFKAHFAEPIKEGLYADSSRYEQRKSIMKLQILHKDIQPKVHRANIEALRGSIPPKVEFVIFVSLQELQRDLYSRYIRAVKAFIDADEREEGAQKTSQVVFMSMLSVLTLLTGHPICFRDKLLEPPSEKKSKNGKKGQADGVDTESDAGGGTPSTASGSATPLNPDITTAPELLDAEADIVVDAHVSAQGLTPERVLQILGGDGSHIGTQPGLSSKITIFLKLLRHSLVARDRVIVFSQRLHMLDYLGHLLKAERINFGRIDGSNMGQRMKLIQDFEEGVFDVMLVSTKAGGVGLNMQCANRVFIFDSGFNPTYEEQAIGRAYRLGQKKPVYVYRFVTGGTFETNIYNKQLLKTSLAQRVVDKKNPRRAAERNTRDYLYEPQLVPQHDITEHINKDPLVLGKLLEQHGTGNGKFDTMIRDVKTMETLTEEIMDEPLDQEEQRAVAEETEARKQRPRGKKAAAMAGAAGFPSMMPPRPYIPPPPGPPMIPNLSDMAPPP